MLFQALYVHGAETFVGTITKIIDGDSLLISTGEERIEIRLYGIDCPEYRQPYSRAAKKYIKNSVSGSRVRVQSYYRDTYDRKVSMVFFGDKVLNGELVEAGLAWVYPAYCRKPICDDWRRKEEMARRDKKGLWRDPDAIAPWRWKRMRK